MSYQEFEDEDGENFQWVCDGPNNNTEKKGCWNYVDLEGPLEFAEISNEQLLELLMEEVDVMYRENEIRKIDDYKAEVLRRMKK
jgi:hypothetical protein